MTERPNRAPDLRRLSYVNAKNPAVYRRPFWLPASNYYILAAAVSLALFFLVWGILHEGDEPVPWVPAGISASLVLIGAVFLREIVLRKARNRFLRIQERLDRNLDNATFHARGSGPDRKLSVDENAEIIRRIREKSDAAKVLMRLGAGHREVFEMCREYLDVNRREVDRAGAGSPRLGGLLRGREQVKALHKFHVLAWAEVESTRFTHEARNRVTISEKTEAAQRALEVIRTALESYPGEEKLIESEKAVREFITTIRVGHYVEQAERAAFKGENQRAVSHYKDALYYLAREAGRTPDIEFLAQKINIEMRKLLEIPTPDKNLGVNRHD